MILPSFLGALGPRGRGGHIAILAVGRRRRAAGGRGVSSWRGLMPELRELLLQEARDLRSEEEPIGAVAEARHADRGMDPKLNQLHRVSGSEKLLGHERYGR